MPILFRPVAVSLSCSFLLFFGFSCPSLLAQRYGPPQMVTLGREPGTSVVVPDPTQSFDVAQTIMKNNQRVGQQGATGETACFLPPLAGIKIPSVGVGALAAEARANVEYEKACEAIASNKFDSAEKHVHKALEAYPDYSTSLVLLGQLRAKRDQLPEAQEACQHATKVAPTFGAAYLCLAEIAAHARKWDEVLKQSDQALVLDPATSAISYLFSTEANFSLHRFAEAEKSGLRALRFASKDIDPRQLHYLLAEIYEAKGDLANEVAQLREFLKVAGNSKEAEIVKQYLAKLGAAPGAAASIVPAAK